MSLPEQEVNSLKETRRLVSAFMLEEGWIVEPMTCRYCLGEGANALGYDCHRCRGAGQIYGFDAFKLRLRDATKHYPYDIVIEEKWGIT